MITLALIGAGKWGKNYLRAVANLDDVEIKYICTQNQHTLDSLPNIYIKTLSINDLLKFPKIQGFIIATPAITHFSIAKKLLSLGQNILIEKPLTVNYNQALKLQKIWQKKKPCVLVGHTYLYSPAYQKFKKQVKNIGSIKSVSFEGLGSPVRKDVSVIWDWGPHPVSLMLNLIKQPITGVSAIGSSKDSINNLYDTLKAEIRYKSGIKALIHVSWLGSEKIRKLIINEKNKKIELDYTTNTHSAEDALTRELLEFKEAVQDGKTITSDINRGAEVVKILSAIEQSALLDGKLIRLS